MSVTDRLAGTLLGLAAGDALGAGYEFQADPLGSDRKAEMTGGGLGGFEPGEWTDDTSMAVCIAEVTANGGEVQVDAIGDRFLDWYRQGPKDVGVSTAAVLRQAERGADLPGLAADYFDALPRLPPRPADWNTVIRDGTIPASSPTGSRTPTTSWLTHPHGRFSGLSEATTTTRRRSAGGVGAPPHGAPPARP